MPSTLRFCVEDGFLHCILSPMAGWTCQVRSQGTASELADKLLDAAAQGILSAMRGTYSTWVSTP